MEVVKLRYFKEDNSTVNFSSITTNVDIHVSKFDLNRCDERTFYLTIILKHGQYQAICDLIFLVDKDELYGAISLNSLYEHAQHFFKQQFNYELLYRDEMHIAKIVANTPQFKDSFNKYSAKFPKYTTTKKDHTAV